MIIESILPEFKFSNFDTCINFLKGKFAAKTRNERENKCDDVLRLIHIDMYGPITPISMGGYMYFIKCVRPDKGGEYYGRCDETRYTRA